MREAVLETIRGLLPAFNMEVNDLNTGYFFALFVVGVTLLALIVIRVILKILFRRKRCHSIHIKSDNGDDVISGSAIMAVIKALENEFKALTINKVNLFRYRRIPFLEVYLDFDASKGGLPDHSGKFKKRVSESLDAIFGIKNIRFAKIHVRHVQLHNADILSPAMETHKTAEISVGNLQVPGKEEEKKPAADKEAPADDQDKK